MQGETSLGFAADRPVFAGHFPGVQLLDAAVHAVMQAFQQAGDKVPPACQISLAKFLSPTSPGEP